VIRLSELDSQQGKDVILLSVPSRAAQGPIKPAELYSLSALFLGAKLPVREADHSPLSSADVENA
jgi:hypothetical protein